MTPIGSLIRRIRLLLRRGRAEQEMAEEMRFHLDMRAAEQAADGVPAEEAHYAARRRFGNLGVVQEESREELGFLWWEQFLQDVRYAAHTLRRNVGFTVVALLTLALGIGVNTTAFTVLNRLLLRPVPFRDPGRLVRIDAAYADGPPRALPSGDFLDVRAQNTVFERVASYYGVNWMTTLVEPGRPATRCDSLDVTADFLPLMGIDTLALGRGFTPADEARRDRLALLSHAFWVRHYGADPHVLGRPLKTDGGLEYTIVGVMAPSLDDPTLFRGAIDGIAFYLLASDMDPDFREWGWTTVVARLKPGVSIEAAQAELTVLARRLEHDHPKTNAGRGLKVTPYPTNPLDETTQRLIWLVMGLSGVVLLLACVNLANLQLVRTTGRGNELGIRLALGCTRGRLIRMLLTESVIISMAGGALGLLMALWSGGFLAAYWKVDMPLNPRVIGFTFAVSAAAGAVFGSVPAYFAGRSGVGSSLKPGARGATPDQSRHRFRQALIVVELAMAMILLSGAGYFVRGIERITHRYLGWRPDNVLIGYIALDHGHYGEIRDPRSLAFGDRLLPRLAALPGVDAAALSNDDVFDANPVNFEIEGKPLLGNDIQAAFETPSPGYFRAFGIELLQGRDFRDTDRPGTPRVAIISQDLAQKFWPGESALGKRIGIDDPAHQNWAEVVGVVNNILHDREWDSRRSRYAIYYPWAQNSFRYISITLHSRGSAEGLMKGVRETVGRIEPNIALSYLDTANNMMALDLRDYTLARRTLVQMAGLGLLLAAVGIYGVIANLATERTREVGIRMALGAQERDVVWLFLGNGVRLAFIGTALGLLGAYGLTKGLEHLVSDFPGRDPLIMGGVALLLVGVTILACWLPARAATKVDPIQALRAD